MNYLELSDIEYEYVALLKRIEVCTYKFQHISETIARIKDFYMLFSKRGEDIIDELLDMDLEIYQAKLNSFYYERYCMLILGIHKNLMVGLSGEITLPFPITTDNAKAAVDEYVPSEILHDAPYSACLLALKLVVKDFEEQIDDYRKYRKKISSDYLNSSNEPLSIIAETLNKTDDAMKEDVFGNLKKIAKDLNKRVDRELKRISEE